MSAAQECPLDTQGRILVPPELRNRAQLSGKILFVSMIDCFEIWKRDAYMEKYGNRIEAISEIEEQLSQLPKKTGI